MTYAGGLACACSVCTAAAPSVKLPIAIATINFACMLLLPFVRHARRRTRQVGPPMADGCFFNSRVSAPPSTRAYKHNLQAPRACAEAGNMARTLGWILPDEVRGLADQSLPSDRHGDGTAHNPRRRTSGAKARQQMLQQSEACEQQTRPYCRAEIKRHPGNFAVPASDVVSDDPARCDIVQAGKKPQEFPMRRQVRA